MITLSKRSDYPAIIQVINDDGSAHDLSGYTRIDVFLQYENSFETIKSFTTSNGSAVISSPTSGEITIFIKRDDASILAIRNNVSIFYTIKVWEVDTDFTDNIAKIETLPVEFCKFIQSAGYGS